MHCTAHQYHCTALHCTYSKPSPGQPPLPGPQVRVTTAPQQSLLEEVAERGGGSYAGRIRAFMNPLQGGRLVYITCQGGRGLHKRLRGRRGYMTICKEGGKRCLQSNDCYWKNWKLSKTLFRVNLWLNISPHKLRKLW